MDATPDDRAALERVLGELQNAKLWGGCCPRQHVEAVWAAHAALYRVQSRAVWVAALAVTLRIELEHRLDNELWRAGKSPDHPHRRPDRSARDLLGEVRGRSYPAPVPRRLNENLIELALAECNLGGKGGRGKRGGMTPERWADKLAEKLAKLGRK